MNRELWQRVKTIAADAWERPAAERAAYVASRCGGDVALTHEVLSLLEAMAEAGDRFETPAIVISGAGLAGTGAPERQPMSAGDRLGPWQIVRELGHGGMGTVYLAVRVGAEFTQRVAIKIVRGGAANQVLLRRFRDERRILAALEHPHIARFIDGDVTPLGLPYAVMEYVDGLSIDAYCDRRQLDRRQRIALFQQVCAAAEYAHRRLIVHRDIKASNILVTADGVPKLLDFGIAKILQTDRPSDTTLVRMVTPESASPEQIRGEPVTTATDVYALGVLLYRLLTAQSPYRVDSGSEIQLMQAICDQQPSPPSTIAPGIDADLDHIVLKALRKEPERRYGSAEQLSDDLQRYLDGRPVLARPDSAIYRARKFVARHRIAVAAAAALVVTVAAGGAATAWQARVAERERARAERQFNAVRTLASSVLGELHDAVNALQGSTAARELLLRRATEYLDGLSGEAGGDVALQRELAAGYRRLARVQGASGGSNVGDRDAAEASARKAVALLEPLAVSPGEAADRVELASAYVSLALLVRKDDREREALNQRAIALLEALPEDARNTPTALSIAVRVWHAVGRAQLDTKDYTSANSSFTHEVRAAEAALALSPDSQIAARNLALALQQLGTTYELLERPEDAIATYQRALAIIQRLVERFGTDAELKLDLSFSYGTLGAALLSAGDVAGARRHYQRAVELREAVAANDPENDWARSAVAFGYQRLGLVEAKAGDADASLRWYEKSLDVLQRRAAAHPERERPWIEYANALFESATECTALLESSDVPPRARARMAARIDKMTDGLLRLRARWTRERRQTPLPPADTELQQLRARMGRLYSAGVATTPPPR